MSEWLNCQTLLHRATFAQKERDIWCKETCCRCKFVSFLHSCPRGASGLFLRQISLINPVIHSGRLTKQPIDRILAYLFYFAPRGNFEEKAAHSTTWLFILRTQTHLMAFNGMHYFIWLISPERETFFHFFTFLEKAVAYCTQVSVQVNVPSCSMLHTFFSVQSVHNVKKGFYLIHVVLWQAKWFLGAVEGSKYF